MLRFTLLLLAASSLFAQLDTNSISVSASRIVNLAPDQAVFGVFVVTPTSSTLSDVVAALQGAPITVANFSGVGTPQNGQQTNSMLEWTFGLPVPFAKMKDTLTLLTSLQQTFTQNGTGFTLRFSVAGTLTSQAAQQSVTCSVSDLLADAKSQAQKLADAAGVGLGPVLALSGISNTTASLGTAIPGISISPYYSSSFSPSYAAPCSLTVKFGLTR